MAAPRPELKFAGFNVDRTVWEQIKAVAKREDRSASGMARIFLREGLERYVAQTSGAQTE
jgi:hypothetical protein